MSMTTILDTTQNTTNTLSLFARGVIINGKPVERWGANERSLTKPLHWHKAQHVQLTVDLFRESIPDEWLDRIFAVMALAHQHQFQVLTKRPNRMLAYVQRLSRNIAPLESAARMLGYTFKFCGLDGKEYSTLPFPVPNVWLGVSCEDQETADERIPLLLQTSAAVRFISAEPLLSAIDLRSLRHRICADDSPIKPIGGCIEEYDALRGEMVHNRLGYDVPKLDWTIIGGESGPHARPCDISNIRGIVEQCKAADVACFVKQLGSKPFMGVKGFGPVITDRKGGDINEFPEDLRIREFPRAGATPQERRCDAASPCGLRSERVR